MFLAVNIAAAFEMFLHNSLELRRSPVHGFGVFSKTDLPAQLVLWQNTQVISPPYLWRLEELLEQPASLQSRLRGTCRQVDRDLWIGLHKTTQDAADLSFFVNHGCQPNAFFGTCSLKTSRAVQAGEEILVDYGTFASHPWGLHFPCTCSGSLCRNRVRPTDYLIYPQKKHLMPYLHRLP